jgi:hypothetical protein
MADQRVLDHADDASAFTAIHNSVKRGDIIAVTGKPGACKSGELSIFPVHMEVCCQILQADCLKTCFLCLRSALTVHPYVLWPSVDYGVTVHELH